MILNFYPMSPEQIIVERISSMGTTGIKKIDINTITLDELKTHPYIRFSIASAIIAFRNEHGPFQKIDDIKKVMAVTDEIYKKCYPYLTTVNE